MKTKNIFGLLILVATFIISPYFSEANFKFLYYPFQNINPLVLQGWEYTWGEKHEGIDYECERGENIYTVADGMAMTSSQPLKPGSKKAYGNFVLVNHQNGYFTLYAHLDSVENKIKKYPPDKRWNTNYNEWTFINKGEKIGGCGKSGAEYTVTHLHFELSKGYAIGRADAYDIYKTAYYYPPKGSKYTSLGPNHFWSSEAIATILNLSTQKETPAVRNSSPEKIVKEKDELPPEKSFWEKVRDGISKFFAKISNTLFTKLKEKFARLSPIKQDGVALKEEKPPTEENISSGKYINIADKDDFIVLSEDGSFYAPYSFSSSFKGYGAEYKINADYEFSGRYSVQGNNVIFNIKRLKVKSEGTDIETDLFGSIPPTKCAIVIAFRVKSGFDCADGTQYRRAKEKEEESKEETKKVSEIAKKVGPAALVSPSPTAAKKKPKEGNLLKLSAFVVNQLGQPEQEAKFVLEDSRHYPRVTGETNQSGYLEIDISSLPKESFTLSLKTEKLGPLTEIIGRYDTFDREIYFSGQDISLGTIIIHKWSKITAKVIDDSGSPIGNLCSTFEVIDEDGHSPNYYPKYPSHWKYISEYDNGFVESYLLPDGKYTFKAKTNWDCPLGKYTTVERKINIAGKDVFIGEIIVPRI